MSDHLLGRRLEEPAGTPLVVVVDEFGPLFWTGRLAAELLALGREAGVPVVLLSQGPSDLDAIAKHALHQVAQDAAWILAFPQGPLAAETMAKLLGRQWVEERSWGNDNRGTSGRRCAWSSGPSSRPRPWSNWSLAMRG